jgi:hemoglobin-like flavoprotein
VVADTLLWTLQQGLGAAFTKDVKEAWEAALSVIAGVMIAGANCEYANFDVWKVQQSS